MSSAAAQWLGSASCSLSLRRMARNSRRAVLLRGSSPGSAAGRRWPSGAAGCCPSPEVAARWGSPWWTAAGCCSTRGSASGAEGVAGHHPSAMAGACSAGCSAAKALSRVPAARTVLAYFGQCCSGRHGLLCSVDMCSACVPHLAHTRCRRPWPCCCRGICDLQAHSTRGAGAGGVAGVVPFLQFLQVSNLRLIVDSQAAPASDVAPPMDTTGMGHLVRAVTALWAPSQVRSQRLHCQWPLIL